ncbi:MAG: BrnT family toxin [Gammaproteobacteria bacterium]|nr:BrnT family toxin [Gammaproteobacteria bacterium]
MSLRLLRLAALADKDLFLDFDLQKDAVNRKKHGCGLELAAELDWQTVIAGQDQRRDYGEHRLIGYGLLGQRLFCIVFVVRSNAIRVISLRKANSREVDLYEKTTTHYATDG